MASKDIIIITMCDSYDGEHILQILSKAKEIAEIAKIKVTMICIGAYRGEQFDNLFKHGADQVILYEYMGRKLDYLEQADLISLSINEMKTGCIMIPANSLGKAVAAVLAARYEFGLVADCFDVVVDANSEYRYVRTAMNDSVNAEIKCIGSGFEMCTIKKDVVKISNKEYICEKKITVIKDLPFIKELPKLSIYKEEVMNQKQEIDISRYNMVFCVGRGVEKEKTREKIFKIAEKCSAGIIGTKAAVECGYVEKARQVGQSGKSVTPLIYVGFGVSGAVQHIVGFHKADMIIAINHDENASIFNYADIAVVADVNEIVDRMEELLFHETEAIYV